jgi:hypothetical protein
MQTGLSMIHVIPFNKEIELKNLIFKTTYIIRTKLRYYFILSKFILLIPKHKGLKRFL